MDGNILSFPRSYSKHKYAKTHLSFIIEFARLGGIKVNIVKDTKTIFLINNTMISCELNNKQIIFDYSDFSRRVLAEKYADIPYFKFQCPSKNKPANVFPCGPLFVYAPSKTSILRDYFNVKQKFEYNCISNKILNKQTPKGNALERRKFAQKILLDNFGASDVEISIESNNESFWRKHEKCLCSVCIPGACKNSLDRGQYELMGLGVCIISPVIPVLLPWDKEIIPNEHYLAINDDFSDLVEKVNWCKNNRGECVKIGQNTKKLFDKYLTPAMNWEWIVKCTNDFYK